MSQMIFSKSSRQFHGLPFLKSPLSPSLQKIAENPALLIFSPTLDHQLFSKHIQLIQISHNQPYCLSSLKHSKSFFQHAISITGKTTKHQDASLK